jgi:hypothetical protein
MVDKLADALKRPRVDFRKAAGLAALDQDTSIIASGSTLAITPPLPENTPDEIEADTEEILRTAFGAHGKGLSERDRATIYPFARALAEAARRLKEK